MCLKWVQKPDFWMFWESRLKTCKNCIFLRTNLTYQCWWCFEYKIYWRISNAPEVVIKLPPVSNWRIFEHFLFDFCMTWNFPWGQVLLSIHTNYYVPQLKRFPTAILKMTTANKQTKPFISNCFVLLFSCYCYLTKVSAESQFSVASPEKRSNRFPYWSYILCGDIAQKKYRKHKFYDILHLTWGSRGPCSKESEKQKSKWQFWICIAKALFSICKKQAENLTPPGPSIQIRFLVLRITHVVCVPVSTKTMGITVPPVQGFGLSRQTAIKMCTR